MTAFLDSLVAGIGTGSLLALAALGFTFTLASTGYFNFALESVVSIGTVLAYEFVTAVGIPIWLGGVLVAIVGAVCGILQYLLLVEPVAIRSKSPDRAVLVATIGAAVGIDALLLVLFGSSSRSVTPYVSANSFLIGSVAIQPTYVLDVAVLLVLAVVGSLVMSRTRSGHWLMASQQDPVGTQLLGLNVRTVRYLVFALAGMLAASAGVLLAPSSYAGADVGQRLVILVFVAMVLGGFGSFVGVVIGGIVVGIISEMIPLYLNASAVDPILLAVVVVLLLLRPNGLFSVRERTV